MTATFAPFGFRASRGSVGNNADQEPMQIASTYGTAIYTGDPVKLVTTGYVEKLGTTDALFYGVFCGCEFVSGGIQYVLPYWPASTALTANTVCTAYIYRDPYLEYIVQLGGTATIACIGDEADYVAGTPNTGSGISGAYLSNSFVGAGNSAQFRIVGLAALPGNAWGDAYPIVRVVPNEAAGFLPNGNAV